MDVALIQWPSDEALRAQVGELRQPRLLIVEPDAEPPVCLDVLEDWVRLPVSRVDHDARVRSLASRAGGASTRVPRLQRDGVLEFGGITTHLSAIQADLVRVMIERFGAVVSREGLCSVAWPDGGPSDNNLDVTIGRLRRQLAPIGLRVRTIRSRGYLLTVDEDG